MMLKPENPEELNRATVNHLLTTTRSVRLRLDLSQPVDRTIIAECIEIAIQAPNGGNAGRYHFVVITDPERRAGLAEIYRKAYDEELGQEREEHSKFVVSSNYLADHLHEVPVHIIPCIEGRVEQASPFKLASRYGSILPATWSLMLALRARGLGSAWTTVHIKYEREAGALLGIPENVTQVALLPVAYFRGRDFKPAPRVPGRDHTHWNTW